MNPSSDFPIEKPNWNRVEMTRKQEKAFAIDLKQLVTQWNRVKFTPPERVWDLKRHIRVRTYENQECTPWTGKTPPHLFMFRAPVSAKSLLPAVKKCLDTLFCHLLDVNHAFDTFIDQKQNFIQDYKKRGLTYWPTNSLHSFEAHGAESTYTQFRNFLQQSAYGVIDDFFDVYMERIVSYFSSKFNKPRDFIEKHLQDHGTLYFLKYKPGFGLWMHIDNLVRSDATVFTIGVGRDVVYDVVEVIPEPGEKTTSMLRCRNDEGTMMVLDGEARYKWGHGVPYAEDRTKYTIIFRLFHIDSLSADIGYCEELETKMYTMIE